MLKNWTLILLTGKHIKLLNKVNIPGDPLGIAMLGSINTSFSKLRSSLLLVKIGFGASFNYYSSKHLVRSVLFKTSLHKNLSSSQEGIQVTIFMDIDNYHLKYFLYSIKNISSHYSGNYVYNHQQIFLYKLDIFSKKQHVNVLIKTAFLYGVCTGIYVKNIYKYTIIENIVYMQFGNIICRVKEYIFNNQVVAVKPNLDDVKDISLFEQVHFKLNTAKIMLNWERFRFNT